MTRALIRELCSVCFSWLFHAPRLPQCQKQTQPWASIGHWRRGPAVHGEDGFLPSNGSLITKQQTSVPTAGEAGACHPAQDWWCWYDPVMEDPPRHQPTDKPIKKTQGHHTHTNTSWSYNNGQAQRTEMMDSTWTNLMLNKTLRLKQHKLESRQLYNNHMYTHAFICSKVCTTGLTIFIFKNYVLVHK